MSASASILATLLVALAQSTFASRMEIRLVQMGGHPFIHRCETTLFLPDTRYLENSVTVNCELSDSLKEKQPHIYRQIPLTIDDGLRYRRLIADADLFGGGYVANRTRLCEECGMRYLDVRAGDKEALLQVLFNPTFSSGARRELLQFLQTTQVQVFDEALAARRKR